MAVMSESPVIGAAGAPGQLPAGRYQIDAEHSTVTFTTRHLFGLARVRGTLALRDGTICVAVPATSSTVRARVAASAFRSGNQIRDAAVLSPRLLDAEAYPGLTFTSTELVREETGKPGAGPGQWRLRGELEVRGVTRLVEVRVTALSGTGTTLRASARLSVDRYAFGITAYRGLAARRLTVELGIVAERDETRAARS